MAKKTLKTILSIRVLQNGKMVSELERPLSRSGKIFLSPYFSDELSVPLYPFPKPIQLFSVKGSKANLFIDYQWTGFIISKGKLTKISLANLSGEEFELINGDYGTVSCRDLRIMFRIAPAKIQSKKLVVKSGSYRPQFLSLLADNKSEWAGIGIGMAAAMLLMITGIFAADWIPNKRPTNIDGLDQTYTLPFVSGDHFLNAPEALQENLDRSRIFPQVMAYYRNFVEALMGWESKESLVPPYISQKYQLLRRKAEDKTFEIITRQQDLVADTEQTDHSRRLVIPAVVGESFQHRLIWTLDKIDTLHKSLDATLNERRLTTKEFRKDEGYDYFKFRDVPETGLGATSEYLAQVSLRGRTTNEDQMYHQADILSQKAQRAYDRILSHASDQNWLSPSSLSPIIIKPESRYASFLANADMVFNDAAYEALEAAVYDKNRHQQSKEPLTGTINPKLITKFIKNRSFDLQLCYELALRRDKATKGSTHWQWRIDSRGVISDIELVESTIRDTPMIDCIKDKMLRWTFPRAKQGSVQISHTFEFGPRNG